MDYDLKWVLGFYAAVLLFVLGFWGGVLYLAWKLVEWLTAG